MARGRGTATDRRLAALEDRRMDAIAHSLGTVEHCAEARRLVEAGARVGIVNKLFSLAIIKPLNAAEQEARLIWGCNLAMARDLTVLRDTSRASETPELVAVA